MEDAARGTNSSSSSSSSSRQTGAALRLRWKDQPSGHMWGELTEFWQLPVSVQAAIKHERVAKPWVSLRMSALSFTLRF